MVNEKMIKENYENPEQKLVRILKEKGLDNPEAKKMLINWYEEQDNISEAAENFDDAKVRSDWRLARLYFSAGLDDESLEKYKDTGDEAWQKGWDDLYNEIMDERDSVRDEIALEKEMKKPLTKEAFSASCQKERLLRLQLKKLDVLSKTNDEVLRMVKESNLEGILLAWYDLHVKNKVMQMRMGDSIVLLVPTTLVLMEVAKILKQEQS